MGKQESVIFERAFIVANYFGEKEFTGEYVGCYNMRFQDDIALEILLESDYKREEILLDGYRDWINRVVETLRITITYEHTVVFNHLVTSTQDQHYPLGKETVVFQENNLRYEEGSWESSLLSQRSKISPPLAKESLTHLSAMKDNTERIKNKNDTLFPLYLKRSSLMSEISNLETRIRDGDGVWRYYILSYAPLVYIASIIAWMKCRPLKELLILKKRELSELEEKIKTTT